MTKRTVKSIKVVALASVLSLLGMGTAMANYTATCQAHRVQHHVLSDQQRESLKTIHGKTFKIASPICQQLRAKRAMLNALLLQKKPNVKRINALTAKVTELQDQLLKIRVGERIEMANSADVHLGLGSPHHRMHCSRS